MSASLVGSEMCIRDRPQQARQGETSLRRARSRQESATPEVLAMRTVGACLLYTSDAADDM
eukprot:14883886-Alexandrium_andersonii.AAC.1